MQTSYMDKEVLRGILETCGEFKVSKLSIGDLHLEFSQSERVQAPPPATEIAAQERMAVLQDEQKIKQDQLENMLLEDPEQYEELLLRGELVDGSRSE